MSDKDRSFEEKMKLRFKEIGVALLALILAACLWLPSVHFFFKASDVVSKSGPISKRAKELAQRHLKIWQDPKLRQKELQRMRGRNAEWDFMGRTFLVLALSNMALRSPDTQAGHLEIIDAIIDDTLKVEDEMGMHHFLLGYSQSSSWIQQPERSIFVDGEIAIMLGARRLLAEKLSYKDEFQSRVRLMKKRMEEAPVYCNESYPNECWMFCNSAAAVALKMSDVLDGSKYTEFLNAWLNKIRQELVDKKTGLLPSSFSYRGRIMDGPEGSSIWFTAHCLQLLDREFAKDQYERAKAELAVSICGFSYAKEWPESFRGPMDVDSGPIIPVLEVSAGSSGMAFIAAGAFEDQEFLSSLLGTLDFAGFPLKTEGALKYCASNQVGDAVLLYSLVQGPLWEKILRKGN